MGSLKAILEIGTNSSKENIIQVLSRETALTAKEIHSGLKRSNRNGTTYQATHKAIQQLIEQEVLVEANKKYSISDKWVEGISDFSKSIREELIEKTSTNGEPVIKVFDSFISFGQFIINDFFHKYPDPEGKGCVCLWNHAYPLAGMVSKEEHEALKELFSKNINYSICNSNTCLDKLTMDYLKKLGKRTALNKNSSAKLDTFIIGDYVMQAYFPKNLEQEMDQLYNDIKSEKDLDMQKLFEFGSKKYEIKALIFKNQELADSLREEANELHKQFGQKQEVVVDSIHASNLFLIDFIFEKAPETDGAMYWQWQHYWLPLLITREGYEKLKLLSSENMESYSVVKNDTIVDKWCADFWIQHGFKNSKYGVDFRNDTDTFVLGDCVLQVFYPKELMRKMDDFFEGVRKIEELNIKKLFDEVFLKETKIPITIAKNHEIAKQIKEETKKYFEAGK